MILKEASALKRSDLFLILSSLNHCIDIGIDIPRRCILVEALQLIVQLLNLLFALGNHLVSNVLVHIDWDTSDDLLLLRKHISFLFVTAEDFLVFILDRLDFHLRSETTTLNIIVTLSEVAP